MTDTNEDVKKLANRIVQYETQDKGALGRLFAFEARDGFWSKTLKVLAVAGGITAATSTFGLLAAPIGLVGASIVATGVGLVSATINRGVLKSVLSDIHDTKTSFLGKAAHYMGASVVAGMATAMVAGGAALAISPATSQLSFNLMQSLAAPLAFIGTSKAVSAMTGNQQQRKDSESARELAQRAIESGQSVEQVLSPSHSVEHASSYINSASQEHMESLEQSNYYTNKLSEERRTGKDLAEHGIT